MTVGGYLYGTQVCSCTMSVPATEIESGTALMIANPFGLDTCTSMVGTG